MPANRRRLTPQSQTVVSPTNTLAAEDDPFLDDAEEAPRNHAAKPVTGNTTSGTIGYYGTQGLSSGGYPSGSEGTTLTVFGTTLALAFGWNNNHPHNDIWQIQVPRLPPMIPPPVVVVPACVARRQQHSGVLNPNFFLNFYPIA